MRFPSNILYLLLIILSCQALALNAQDNGKKKKKKKGDDKTETGSLDKSSQQKLSRLFLEAEKAKVTEDWETAIKNYQEVVATDPNNANAHFQLSQIFYNQGKVFE